MHRSLLLGISAIVLGCGVGDRDPVPPNWQSSQSPILLAILQHSVWEGRFSMPLFVAYRDGRVLFPRTRKPFPPAMDLSIPTSYQMAQLSTGEVDSLLTELELGSLMLFPDSLVDFAPNTTDRHSFYFLFPGAAGTRVIQLRAAYTYKGKLRRGVPRALRTALRGSLTFRAARAEPWTPDSIEATIWSYDYAPDSTAVPWPSDLPTLTDPPWVRLDDPNHPNPSQEWSVHLPFSAAPELDRLIAANSQRRAILLDGRKWAVGYHWIFPFDAEWRWLVQRLEF